jgi:tRNA A-37 threonylcarbamoyl transferase component Bud32
MTSEPLTTPDTLPLDQKRQLDHVCDHFEAAWKAGRRPAIEAHLADVPEPLLLPLLHELVLLEAHYRRLRGELPHPQDYAGRFPRLAAWLEEALAPPRADGETPTPSPGQTVRVATATAAGTRLGGYELVEVLGRGGMGVVWKARQTKANRLVALKLILAGELAGEADVRRFRAEAEIAAGLDHPNLVPLYEVGEDHGRHFFSMKLIGGGHLGQHLAHFRDRPREAASLLLAVARAVQHAHQHGLLHRDLKPGNILLEWPAGGGTPPVPHVTDFGLARRLEAPAGLTQSGAVVGTPEYMAPEQARGDKAALTIATDVYGLGAVLYALLTGRPPFQGESVLRTLEQVVGSEPLPPRGLNPQVPRDLETVCLKCLRKEPAQRYGSAADLAEELRRFLAGEPIAARPAGGLERAWRWCRRNPAVAALLALVAASLVLGTTVATLFAFWALGEARVAQKEKEDADTARTMAESETKRADAAARTAQHNEQLALEQKRQVEIEKAEKERQLGRAEWLLYAGRLDQAQRYWQEGNVAGARPARRLPLGLPGLGAPLSAHALQRLPPHARGAHLLGGGRVLQSRRQTPRQRRRPGPVGQSVGCTDPATAPLAAARRRRGVCRLQPGRDPPRQRHREQRGQRQTVHPRRSQGVGCGQREGTARAQGPHGRRPLCLLQSGRPTPCQCQSRQDRQGVGCPQRSGNPHPQGAQGPGAVRVLPAGRPADRQRFRPRARPTPAGRGESLGRRQRSRTHLAPESLLGRQQRVLQSRRPIPCQRPGPRLDSDLGDAGPQAQPRLVK